MSAAGWLRRLLGPDPALIAERDDLAAQVDALAYERDELTEQLSRAEQSNRDLRAARRRLIAEAFEPVQVGGCTKLRYLRPADAEQHAIQIAQRAWGECFNAYPCRVC